MSSAHVDVLVIGGGPAGLSAALVLGRSRRSVLVCDGQEPRNGPSLAAHNFLTRDGAAPLELRHLGQAELAAYPSVSHAEATVHAVTGGDGRFAATLSDGRTLAARKLIFATGVRDAPPTIAGLAERWGGTIVHCPYCDAWELRDQPLAVYAQGEKAIHLPPLIRHWSRDLVLLTDGPADLPAEERARFAEWGIAIIETPIARFQGDDERLEVVFRDGSTFSRRALFMEPPELPRSELAARLGCGLIEEPPVPGIIRVDPYQATTVPGVYAAGDVAMPLHQIALAAGSGVLAGIAVNYALVQDDLAG